MGPWFWRTKRCVWSGKIDTPRCRNSHWWLRPADLLSAWKSERFFGRVEVRSARVIKLAWSLVLTCQEE